MRAPPRPVRNVLMVNAPESLESTWNLQISRICYIAVFRVISSFSFQINNSSQSWLWRRRPLGNSKLQNCAGHKNQTSLWTSVPGWWAKVPGSTRFLGSPMRSESWVTRGIVKSRTRQGELRRNRPNFLSLFPSSCASPHHNKRRQESPSFLGLCLLIRVRKGK